MHSTKNFNIVSRKPYDLSQQRKIYVYLAEDSVARGFVVKATVWIGSRVSLSESKSGVKS